jgi:hypothetical protein
VLRDMPHVVDAKLILDLRKREQYEDHVTADIVALEQKRHTDTHSRGYYLREWSGCIAWLPDAVEQSIALGKTRERAVRTSRDRMVRFIDKRLKGESK